MDVKLFTALIIYFGNDPQATDKIKEAMQVIKAEEVRADSFLCYDTIRAIAKIRKQKK